MLINSDQNSTIRIITFKKCLFENRIYENDDGLSRFDDKFAENLITHEIDLEFRFNLENFSKLLEIYLVAYDYYKDTNNKKFTFYKERVKKLVQKVDLFKLTLSEFISRSEKYVIEDVDRLNTTGEKDISGDENAFEQFFKDQDEPTEKRTANEIIEEHDSSNTSTFQLILRNLENQSSNLNSRLTERRRTILSKSFGEETQCVSLSDRRKAEKFEIKFELYQAALENLMDCMVEKTIRSTLDIKTKFKLISKEYENIENNVKLDKILFDLDKNMALEITEANKQIEEEKKAAILGLRDKFRLI